MVRWCLREKGVTLAGPPPATLVDPVPPDALRAEVRETLDRVIGLGLEPMDLMAWQAFWVFVIVRISSRLFRRTVLKSANTGSFFRLSTWRKPASS